MGPSARNPLPQRRVGVVLFQLGGPDSPAAIEPFLYNLFCDPDIIDFPLARIGRKPLARLIASARAKKVAHHYALIGGASPIRRFTQQQARVLEAALNAVAGTQPGLKPDSEWASVAALKGRSSTGNRPPLETGSSPADEGAGEEFGEQIPPGRSTVMAEAMTCQLPRNDKNNGAAVAALKGRSSTGTDFEAVKSRASTGARSLDTGHWVLDTEFKVFTAMRYWHPLTSEAVAQVRAAKCDELVLLPLYPQYSSTTTGSSLNEWRRQFPHPLPTRVIEDFYRNQNYLDALCQRVDEALARFPAADEVELIFSAHSVPVAVVEKGDPYQRQIEATVAGLLERGGWKNRHHLCYQSKLGASRWLQPSLRGVIRQRAAAGARRLCVAPISFVSDHLETLAEVNHEARQLALACGIEQFEMSTGLNDSPKFIAALAELVLQATEVPALACSAGSGWGAGGTAAAAELVAGD